MSSLFTGSSASRGSWWALAPSSSMRSLPGTPRSSLGPTEIGPRSPGGGGGGGCVCVSEKANGIDRYQLTPETGTTTIAAAKITSEESAADTICPNPQENIMAVSTPNEDNESRYAKIQEISIQGKPYEVSAYRTAPHDTVKGVIRGIPIDVSADELDRNIVNERNPLAP
ncbi:hypothetical protein HPB49_017386 [Dermacentor silvarum]|uniref:Uncharacterized protein n=1 Tax=Dermacentor silvarum TaxID=543639 RepID=A0ACB8E1X1_DERSI|nr:hypothetical protein HPB49_017386 [Dermacentor silvarum]